LESTKFLDDVSDINFTTRIYCIINNITEIPKCKICGNNTMPNKKDQKLGWNEFCSDKCRKSREILSLEINNKLKDYDWLYNQRIKESILKNQSN